MALIKVFCDLFVEPSSFLLNSLNSSTNLGPFFLLASIEKNGLCSFTLLFEINHTEYNDIKYHTLAIIRHTFIKNLSLFGATCIKIFDDFFYF